MENIVGALLPSAQPPVYSNSACLDLAKQIIFSLSDIVAAVKTQSKGKALDSDEILNDINKVVVSCNL